MIEKNDNISTKEPIGNKHHEMAQPDNKHTFVEVCAGCGGMSTGLIKAGMTPILLNDIDKNCCETLRRNHTTAKIKCCSMTDLKVKKYKNKVDLLAGGVPCQAFSQAGMRKGFDDARGSLMLEFIKMVKRIEPKMFMIENVRGLVTHNGGKTIKEIIDRLNENDLYNIRYKVLNAVNYDVPQKRERVIIVGVLKKYCVEFKYPKKVITLSLSEKHLKMCHIQNVAHTPRKKKSCSV